MIKRPQEPLDHGKDMRQDALEAVIWQHKAADEKLDLRAIELY